MKTYQFALNGLGKALELAMQLILILWHVDSLTSHDIKGEVVRMRVLYT